MYLSEEDGASGPIITQNEGYSKIHIAVLNGNINTISMLYKLNPDCVEELTERDGYTALHLAALSGHTNIVQLLLKLNSDIRHKKDSEGFSPLHIAVLHGHFEVVKEMAEFFPDTCTEKGIAHHWYYSKIYGIKSFCAVSPLHLAALRGHITIVRFLLESFPNFIADIDKDADCLGYTPLRLAIQHGHTEIVKLLLKILPEEARANAIKKSVLDVHTLIQLASIHGHTEIVNILLGYISYEERIAIIHKKTQLGNTALSLAVSQGYANTVKTLMQNTPSKAIEKVDYENLKALAIRKGHKATARTLEKYEKAESIRNAKLGILFGFMAIGCGIAALALKTTIVGIPAGLLLGIGAFVFASISLNYTDPNKDTIDLPFYKAISSNNKSKLIHSAVKQNYTHYIK